MSAAIPIMLMVVVVFMSMVMRVMMVVIMPAAPVMVMVVVMIAVRMPVPHQPTLKPRWPAAGPAGQGGRHRKRFFDTAEIITHGSNLQKSMLLSF